MECSGIELCGRKTIRWSHTLAPCHAVQLCATLLFCLHHESVPAYLNACCSLSHVHTDIVYCAVPGLVHNLYIGFDYLMLELEFFYCLYLPLAKWHHILNLNTVNCWVHLSVANYAESILEFDLLTCVLISLIKQHRVQAPSEYKSLDECRVN